MHPFSQILSFFQGKDLGPCRSLGARRLRLEFSEGSARRPRELPGGGGGSRGLDAVRGVSGFSQQDLHVQLHL